MKYAAPVAGALGIEMEDLSVAIGLMGNAGVKGSQSGTALRSGLTRLVDPTSEAANAMKKYGVELVKNDDETVNLEATMANLRGTIGELDATTQAQVVSTIFGKEAMSGWMAVINASDTDMTKLTNSVKGSTGVMQYWSQEMENAGMSAEDTQKNLSLLDDIFEECKMTADYLGMSSADLGKVITMLGKDGKVTTQEVEGLLNAMFSMVNPTGEAKDAMDNLGIEMKKLDSGAIDTNGTLLSLRDGLKGLTKEEQENAIAKMGLSDSQDQLNQLLSMSDEEFNNYIQSLDNTKGASERLADTMQENLGGSIDNMKSALEGAMYEGFKVLEPILESCIEKITEVANWFTELDEEEQKNIMTMLAVAGAMGPLLSLIGQLTILGGNAVTLFGAMNGAMTASGGATTGLSKVLSVLSGLALPAVALALVGLAAHIGDNEGAILSLQDKYGGFGTFIGGVMEFISGAVQVTIGYMIELFKGGFDVIGAIIDGPGGRTVEDATKQMNENMNLCMEEGMQKMFLTTTRGMSQLRNASDEQLGGTVSSMETIMDAIPNIVDGKYRTAANNLGAQLAQMDFTQISILQGMNDTTKMMFEGIKQGMSVEEASKKVEQNLKQMATAGKIDADTMSKDVSTAMEQMKSQMDTKTKEGATSVDTNMDKAAKDVNEATTKIKSDVNKNMNTSSADMKNKSKEGADSISQNYSKGASSANTELNKISSGTKSNMDKSTQAIRQSGSDMYNGVKTSFSKMEQVCKQHATEMYKGVQTSAKKMADSAKTAASDMYRGVTTSTSKMADKAIADWNRIRTSYSKSIKGSVTVTKTTVNKTETASLEPSSDSQMPIPFNDIIRAVSIPDTYNLRTGHYSIPSQGNNIINNNITDTSGKEISRLYDLLSKTMNKDNSVVIKIEKFINNTEADLDSLMDDIAERIKRKSLV